MISREAYADLLTVPYRRYGRTTQGLDCVGLFVLIQRRLGRQLKAYETDEQAVMEIAAADWQRVDKPEPGDGILFRSTNPRWHVGTVIGANLFIHAKEDAGCVIERFDTALYQRRIEGFYRWKASVQSGF